MTQNDPTEIARVAAGLTRAQREVMMHPNAGETAFGWASISTLEALHRKGLVGRIGGPGAFYDPRVFITWPFTTFGSALRDILREKSGG